MTQQKLHIWACEEKKIDFRREHFKATRCTVAFAAVELMEYLQKLSFEVSFGHEMSEEARLASGPYTRMITCRVEPLR